MLTLKNQRAYGLLFRAGLLAAGLIFPGLLHSQASNQIATGDPSKAQHPSMTITVLPASSLDSRKIEIEMPSSVDSSSLMISLNGKDVASEFTQTPCSNGSGQCETGTVAATHGLRDGKNVLYAAAKSDSGVVSSRVRFDGVESSKALGPQGVKSHGMLGASSNATALPTGSDFLPPTISFNTLGSGGVSGGQPWIQLGDQVQLPTASGCNSIYSIVVLDRQTLQQVTTAPESSPQCISDGATLNSKLKQMTAQDLVIVGTNLFFNSDAGAAAKKLDTTPIGGRVYNCDPTNACKGITGATTDVPQGYLVIGAGGATPGTAFENYYTTSDIPVTVPNAKGMLEEDPWGNYNFQPAGSVEYTVSPAPQSGGGTASITMSQLFGANYLGYKGVFQPPATNGSGGYWLIKVDRDTLVPVTYTSATVDSATGIATFANVGYFYPTANSNEAVATPVYSALAADLNATARNQLVIMTTIGTPIIGTSEQSAAWISSGNVAAYYNNFAPAIEAFGVPAPSTLYLFNDTDAMSLVSCIGCGNAVTGNSVFSTTKNSQQGQTGFLHGLLQPDMHGLYWPVRTDQISPGGSLVDYSLNEILSQQPGEWPELSGSLMSGASTVTGQVAAYRYLSYMSITQHYIVGAQGNYLDDIHYYFAGTNNTFLDYHTFDPSTLAFPGAPNTCYTWTDPVTNTPLSCFTQQDMQAVAGQLKAELVDLGNVMQFMVNGSANMKDIVASGNSSAATALIGAAATVMGSTLQPPPATPVTANVSNILSLVGNVVNLGATIATGGLVPPDLSSIVSSSGNMISAVFGGAGAYAGGFQNSGATYLPSPQYNLSTTIGDLANSQLQQQFSIGFDTQLDTILGDWNKLSQLGPKITNSNLPIYSSPNQVAQNVSVTLLGQASQRAFYMALVPTAYSVEYYKAWGDPFPDMGIRESTSDCNRWYAASDLVPGTYVHYPTYVGIGIPWYVWQINSPAFPVDVYVLASPNAHNPGKSDQSFQVIDSQLASTLFTTGNGGLNLPVDQVFGRTGPLSSVFLDATVSKFDNYNETWLAVCNNGDGLDLSGTPLYTSTTMTATPSTATAGQSVVLKAAVKANSGTATGSVDFREGNTILGTATVDTTGSATLTLNTLAAGTHSIAAYYSDGNGASNFLPSTSPAVKITINVPVPDMSLSLSSTSLSVTSSGPSSPVTLTVSSVAGMTGQVSFACSGLPLGLACNFTPAQGTLPSNGSVTSSFTVSETSAAKTASAMGSFKSYGGIGLFVVSIALLYQIAKGRKHIRTFAWVLALVGLSSVVALTGCGSNNNSNHPTGSATVLVSATSGGTTRSIPMTVNVQ